MEESARIFTKVASRQLKSKLMQLPWEVRRRILQSLLVHDRAMTPLVPCESVGRDKTRQLSFLHDARNTFLVCQQMYYESVKVFFSENAFEIVAEYSTDPGISVKMMQYERVYASSFYLAVEHANHNPAWLKWDFWNSIGSNYRGARHFELAFLEPEPEQVEDIFLVCHTLAPLLKDKQVDICIDDGDWYEINPFSANFLRERIIAIMKALGGLRCRTARVKCERIKHFPGNDHVLEDWEQESNREWASEIQKLIALIEGQSNVPELLGQWSDFVQQPSMMFPEVTLKDYRTHANNSDTLCAAIFKSMTTHDQAGFDKHISELRRKIDVLFGHLQECDLDEDDCELLHSEYH